MRRLIVVSLIILAGCATGREAMKHEGREQAAETRQPAGVEVMLAEPKHPAQVQEPVNAAAAPVNQPRISDPLEITQEKTRGEGKTAASVRLQADPHPAQVFREPSSSSNNSSALEQEMLETHASPEKSSRLSAFAALNDEKLLKVYVGMPRKQVESIMGISRHAGIRSNPYKEETIKSGADQRFDVLFYLTREPSRGRSIMNRHMTPVIFKDDLVYAIGHYQFKKLKRMTAPAAAAPKPIEIVIKKPVR